MLSFSENKNKRDSKAEAKALDAEDKVDHALTSSTTSAKKPAWVDKHASKLKVSIDELSRLRKLKKTEDEKVIEGGEYTKRL